MRDKQIEEMAKDLGIAFQLAGTTRFGAVAEVLVDTGYCKASDVAREIFEEIEKLIYSKCFSVRADRDVTGLIIDGEKFAELKKKYESEGEG